MTDLQRIEFELLKVFVDICNELNLRCYLVCGTALGAVKYNGFIPWDDDIDVGMLREDYERFLKEAPKLLPQHLFLQNYKTDANYTQIFSKIRNSNTTYIEKSVAGININHGIYIDIFPLDGYPDNIKEQKKLEFRKKIYMSFLACNYKSVGSWKLKLLTKTLRIIGVHKKNNEILSRYEKNISKYNAATSSLICNHGNWQGKLEYAPREQYGEGVLVKFEGLDVRVPGMYDSYLTQKYGDWRADLPENEKLGHHFYEILDTEKSYMEYIEKVSKDGKRIWLKNH